MQVRDLNSQKDKAENEVQQVKEKNDALFRKVGACPQPCTLQCAARAVSSHKLEMPAFVHVSAAHWMADLTRWSCQYCCSFACRPTFRSACNANLACAHSTGRSWEQGHAVCNAHLNMYGLTSYHGQVSAVRRSTRAFMNAQVEALRAQAQRKIRDANRKEEDGKVALQNLQNLLIERDTEVSKLQVDLRQSKVGLLV